MKGLLSANVPEKFAAIVIALLLWQIVLRQQPVNSASFENVPVLYTQAPEGLIPTGAIKSMRVEATALIGETLTSIDKDKITLWVDLNKGKPGKNRFKVQATYALGGVRLYPRYEDVEVMLEPLQERQLEIKPMVTGSWELYRPGPMTVNPQSVRISGPESVLNRVHEARVNVDLRRLDPGETAEATVQILRLDGTPIDVTTDPPRVTVSIRPVALPPEKSVLIQPTWQGNPRAGYRVESYEIVPNQVKVRGSAEALAGLMYIDTARIDITGVDANRVFSAKLVLPTGVSSDRTDVEVRLYIRRDSLEPPQ
jgi:YbbR domain-containing protein